MLTYLREKRGAQAAASSVGAELRHNAWAAGMYHNDGVIQSAMKAVRFDAWERHEAALHLFVTRSDDPELWADLLEVYAALRKTQIKGAMPPTADELNSLADRLEAAI